MAKIISLCTSKVKGTRKEEIQSGLFIEDYGMDGDAHAGKWHRQVSFLDQERIEDFNKKGALVTPGAFGENIIVSGLNIKDLDVGTLLKCGEVIFEISQKGKECHDHCQIYYRMGECIMPKVGTFATVKKGGKISIGDEIEVISRDTPFPYQAAVITLSDKGFLGERKDVSGPLLVDLLKKDGFEVNEYLLLPDGISPLDKELIRLCDQRQLDLIITTGGTGFSKRDLTPEATLKVMERNAPGISELIRFESLKFTKKAALSRGMSVIRGKTLIINFPGSPKSVQESYEIIRDILSHAIGLLRGTSGERARNNK